MIQEVKDKNSLELITQWREKQKAIKALEDEQSLIERNMKEQFADYKIGDVIRDTVTNKLYCVMTVRVNKWHMSYNEIMFEYELCPFRKDGQLSRYHGNVPYDNPTEFTGERYNIHTKTLIKA